jgi:hypothetical protein
MYICVRTRQGETLYNERFLRSFKKSFYGVHLQYFTQDNLILCSGAPAYHLHVEG